MTQGSIEESLVLELPPPLADDEIGLGMEIELEEQSDASETVGLDDGVVLDMGGDDIDAGDELSWLDAGEDAKDLDVGTDVHDASDGWLDDKPMALDLGYEPETGEDAGSLDQGAEGLDEPRAAPSGEEDDVDLPPMPELAAEEGELELGDS